MVDSMHCILNNETSITFANISIVHYFGRNANKTAESHWSAQAYFLIIEIKDRHFKMFTDPIQSGHSPQL